MADAGATELPSGGLVEDSRAWARVEGSTAVLAPDVGTTATPDVRPARRKLQVGIDRPVKEIDDGMLVGGLTFNYGTVDTDVAVATATAASTPRATASAAA